MKRSRVAAVAVFAVLSLSLETPARAADARSPATGAAGWLDRAIAWISQAVQPVSVLWEKDGTVGTSPVHPVAGTGGANVDRCGAIDPFGAPCA